MGLAALEVRDIVKVVVEEFILVDDGHMILTIHKLSHIAFQIKLFDSKLFVETS